MNKDTARVLGCYILWGLLPVFWKLLSGVNSAYVLAQRIIFSCLFCGTVALIKKHGSDVMGILKDPRERRIFLACGVLITINWGVYILTVALGRILEASLAYYMNPLFSVLIGSLFFKEKMNICQLISVGLAFTGVMISVVGYGEVPYLAIIIGLSFAIYGGIKKKVSAESEVSTFMETMSVVPLALGFIIWAQFSGFTTYSSLTAKEIICLILTGAVTSLPLMMFSKGIKNTPIVTSGILMYINPTLQLLLGVLVYHEEFTETGAVTFGFVWAAVLLFAADSIIKHRRLSRTEI